MFSTQLKTRRSGFRATNMLGATHSEKRFRPLEFESLEPRRVLATYIVPHVFDEAGRVSDVSSAPTFDTTLFAIYSDGLPGTGDNDNTAAGATVNVHIYDGATGLPAVGGSGGVACAPCTFQLDDQNTHAELNVEAAFDQVGGLPGGSLQGFMLIDVTGDEANVALDANLLQSHSGPRDLEGMPLAIVQLGGVQPGQNKSYVIPHIKESDDGLFNDSIFATYAADLPFLPFNAGAASADVDIYLYDQNGDPMLAADGTEVANPATFHLDAATRKMSLLVQDLFDAGGFPQPVVEGYAVVEVRGDAGNVALDHMQTHQRNGTGVQLDLVSIPAIPSEAKANTFVFPHLIEQSGSANTATNTFDTQIFVTYTADQPGQPEENAETSVDIFLFDQVTGELLQNDTGQSICNPCSFPMGTETVGTGSSSTIIGETLRKRTIDVEEIILNSNGGNFLANGIVLGYAIIVVNGDSDAVNMTSAVTNVRSGPNDLAVFGFEPQPIAETADAMNSDDGAPATMQVIPNILDSTGDVSGNTTAIDTTIRAVYSAGQGPIPSGPGATLELFLYDATTGNLLESADGDAVCAPCRGELKSDSPVFEFEIDDLIAGADGGFPTQDVSASAMLVTRGDHEHVHFQVRQDSSTGGSPNVQSFVFEPSSVDTIPVPAWQNPFNRLDVDGNGLVIPRDLLYGLNVLNDTGAHVLPDPPFSPDTPIPYLDVAGNHWIVPLDLVLILNYLNGIGEVEGEAELVLTDQPVTLEPEPAPTSPIIGDLAFSVEPVVASTRIDEPTPDSDVGTEDPPQILVPSFVLPRQVSNVSSLYDNRSLAHREATDHFFALSLEDEELLGDLLGPAL